MNPWNENKLPPKAILLIIVCISFSARGRVHFRSAGSIEKSIDVAAVRAQVPGRVNELLASSIVIKWEFVIKCESYQPYQLKAYFDAYQSNWCYYNFRLWTLWPKAHYAVKRVIESFECKRAFDKIIIWLLLNIW